MTRDEVARECERLGWKLEGPREDKHPDQSTYVILTGPTAISGRGETPLEAYLEACALEGRSPF